MAARTLGTGTAALTVAASMVGTGVFTTTGLLLGDLGSPGAVLIGWALGGVASLAGALCYAELGAAYPENGGEYALLRRTWHPAVGFVAAIASVVVGFSAPIAASGLAFAKYLLAAFPVIGLDERVLATALVAAGTAVHVGRVRFGAATLNAVTAIQMATVVVVAAVGLWLARWDYIGRGPPLHVALESPRFGVGLVYIGFTYAGWNAAAYVAGEIRDPGRALPRGLVLGTMFVTLLYVALNAAILGSAPPMVLAGKVEVAHLATTVALGPVAARWLSVVVAFGLVGSVLAFLLTGSRVVEVLAHEWPRFGFLARSSPERGPTASLALLAVLAIAMIWTAAFDLLLQWIGLVLSLFAAMTVLGVPLSRWREPSLTRPFRVWGRSALVPLIFLAPTVWSMVYTVQQEPRTALAAAGVLALGVGLWLLARRR
jgi:APA family basic amino acid/polyamine antiporter